MQAVVAAFKETTEPKKVFGTGLHIAGQKYVTLKAEDRSLYGKKVRTKHHSALISLLRDRWARLTTVGACREKKAL